MSQSAFLITKVKTKVVSFYSSVLSRLKRVTLSFDAPKSVYTKNNIRRTELSRTFLFQSLFDGLKFTTQNISVDINQHLMTINRCLKTDNKNREIPLLILPTDSSERDKWFYFHLQFN